MFVCKSPQHAGRYAPLVHVTQTPYFLLWEWTKTGQPDNNKSVGVSVYLKVAVEEILSLSLIGQCLCLTAPRLKCTREPLIAVIAVKCS